MIIYNATKEQFRRDQFNDELIPKLREALSRQHRRSGSSEEASWQNSLRYMSTVMEDPEIPNDAGVAIEYVIPASAKRIDFLLSGYDENGSSNVVIVELKQWSDAEEVIDQEDMVVQTFVGGGKRIVPHPSYQAWSYAALLNDLNETVDRDGIDLHPCACLHNYREIKPDPLWAARYEEILAKAPIFAAQDGERLRSFIKRFVRRGDRGKVLFEIESGRIRPSKSLQDELARMLDGNPSFVMIDDQKEVYEQFLALAERSRRDGVKRLMVVEGGPGTGKSVVAVNLLVETISRDMNAQYVTKNAAPRHVYKEKLKGTRAAKSADNLFRSSDSFHTLESDTFDALIIDEAHRLTQKSGFMNNLGENQVKEILKASKCSIFFVDADQIVTIRDIGTPEEIARQAESLGVEVHSARLVSQFRCDGSDGYIAWLDDVLDIRETANKFLDVDYDFDVVADPHDLHAWVMEKNAIANRARMLAGYCWEWPKGDRANPDFHDVRIDEHDFGMSWNLDEGIWALLPDGVGQVGCIHTSQGLEFDYVGVIIGNDLRFENGSVVTDYSRRASTDKSLFGIKKLAKENPFEAERIADRVIKNTYRTLMSRGMKGCRVFCTDAALGEYLKMRLESSRDVLSYLLGSEDLLAAED